MSSLGKHTRTLTGKDDELMKMWLDNLNDIEIAQNMGCTASSIAQWRKKRDLPRNADPGRPRRD